jgi:glycosyltransferase involved in cell wall biosynthesis
MRSGMLLEALAVAGPVDLVVIPVSGPAEPLAWARAFARRVVIIEPPAGDAARDHVTAQLADPRQRERLAATSPLPTQAALAPPTLADAIADLLGGEASPAAVVAHRSYLAPVALELGRCLGAARVVVDADDDDESLLRSLGDHTAADAFGRLVATWLPEADEVWAAAPAEVAAIGERYHLSSMRVVPNAVRVSARPAPLPGTGQLLFVGNLTYAPNVDAARTLAVDVLPRVRAHWGDARLDLVGPGGPEALTEIPAGAGVRVTGFVRTLAPWYERADVVVTPLRHGAGTRIKVLEACGFGRPVVASTAALAGLEDLADSGVVVADGPDATAIAVIGLLTDPDRARAMADAARRAVHLRYSPAAVGPAVRRGALGEIEGSSLDFRLLWHEVTVDCADEDVRRALDAIAPTAVHEFPSTTPMHYSVEGQAGAYRVVEEGDLLETVPTADDARDLVHLRLHRRAFERASLDGWMRMHGALVDLGTVRVLVTGPSGAGKSTLALRLLLDGAGVQGDESVLLRDGQAVAVARPLHLKPGAEQVVPELTDLVPRLPCIGDVLVADPGRMGHRWRISIAPIDHIVVLASDGPVGSIPLSQTQALPALVDQLFPVTETKPALLRALTRTLRGVHCHQLGLGDPAAMVQTLLDDLD